MPINSALPTNPILEQLQKQIDESSKKAADMVTSAEEDLEAIQQKAPAIAEQVQIKAAATEVAQNVADAGDLITQNNVLELYDLTGGNNRLATLIADQALKEKEANKTADEVAAIYDREITGIGFIDEAINSLSAARLETELASDMRDLDRANKNINNFAALTETIVRTQNNTKQAINDAAIAEKFRANAATSQILSDKAELEARKNNAESKRAVLEATAQQADILWKGYQAYNTEESRKIQWENHKKSMEQLALSNKRYQRMLEQDEVDQAFEDGMIRDIQTAQTDLGLDAEDPAIIRGFLRRGGKVAERYMRLLEVGKTQGNTIAMTPADALETFMIADPADTSKSPVKVLLKDVVDRMNKSYLKAKMKLPKGEELKTVYNQTANQMFNEYNENIKEGDSTNPLHAPAFATLSSEMTAIKKEPLYTRVLSKLDMKETNHSTIIEQTARAVQNRVVTPEEAAIGINTIFKSATNYNNEFKMFAKAGFPVQTQYNVDVAIPGYLEGEQAGILEGFVKATAGHLAVASDTIFGTSLYASTQTIDLTDYDKVRLMLVKYMSGLQAEKGE